MRTLASSAVVVAAAALALACGAARGAAMQPDNAVGKEYIEEAAKSHLAVAISFKAENLPNHDAFIATDAMATVTVRCGYSHERRYTTNVVDNDLNPAWRRAVIFYPPARITTAAEVTKECTFKVDLVDVDNWTTTRIGSTREEKLAVDELGKAKRLSLRLRRAGMFSSKKKVVKRSKLNVYIMAEERRGGCEEAWLKWVGDRTVYNKASDVLNVFGDDGTMKTKDILAAAKGGDDEKKELVHKALNTVKEKAEKAAKGTAAAGKVNALMALTQLYTAAGRVLIDASIGIQNKQKCAIYKSGHSRGSIMDDMCGGAGKHCLAGSQFTFCEQGYALVFEKTLEGVAPVMHCNIDDKI